MSTDKPSPATTQKKSGGKFTGLIPLLFGQRKSDDDNSFRIALIFMTFGFVAILMTSIWAGLDSWTTVWMNTLGLSVLVALAASIAGGLLGFLFGIPRSLQRDDGPTNSTDTERPFYSNNTNLEQISDWLTKIIVGVSLMQLPKLESRFDILTSRIAQGYGDAFPEKFSAVMGGTIIVFYSICGFLAVYLWTRIYLKQQLSKIEAGLYGKKLQKQVEKVSMLEMSRLSALLTQFNRARNRIMTIERSGEVKAIIEKAAPLPPKYLDDFQKGRWGGKSKVGDYVIEGKVESNDSGVNPFIVKITVKPVSEDSPLKGRVYFFLHESFDKAYVMTSDVIDNRARIEFESYEAFTVGAVLNGGDIKLELDLNELDDCPPDYKYQGPLATIDDVKEELEALKKSQEENEKLQKKTPAV